MTLPTLEEVLAAWRAWQRTPSIETRDTFVSLMERFDPPPSVDSSEIEVLSPTTGEPEKGDNVILAGQLR